VISKILLQMTSRLKQQIINTHNTVVIEEIIGRVSSYVRQWRRQSGRLDKWQRSRVHIPKSTIIIWHWWSLVLTHW